MGNIIKIKRGNDAPTKDKLQDGELGFDKVNKVLYIGREGADPVKLTPTTASELGAPDNDGTNAIGTWGIDITGKAGSVDWNSIISTPPYTQLKRFTKLGDHYLRIYCKNLVKGRQYQIQLFTQARHSGHETKPWHHPANSFVVGSKETPKGYAILLKANPYDDSTIPPTQRPPVPDWMLNGGILKTEWNFTADDSFYMMELKINNWLLDLIKDWEDPSGPQVIGISKTRDGTGNLKFQFRVKDLENNIVGVTQDTYRVGSIKMDLTKNPIRMDIKYSSIC